MFRKKMVPGLFGFMAFGIWTAILCFLDVQAIGPGGSAVGLASLNRFFHALTGVHRELYVITDWMGLLPVAIGLGFAGLGLSQWIKRKKIKQVDSDLLWLGALYLMMLACYLFFNEWVVNYRPVLIEGFLEASYPSSTTLLVLCVMPTAVMQLNRRMKRGKFKNILRWAIWAFTAFMVMGRLVSGVHWLSDIIGGILLSAGLVGVYTAGSSR